MDEQYSEIHVDGDGNIVGTRITVAVREGRHAGHALTLLDRIDGPTWSCVCDCGAKGRATVPSTAEGEQQP